MIYYKHTKQLLIIAGFFLCAACEAPPAYVYVDKEFDRGSDFFLKGITSRDTVKICYHKKGTTPQQVLILAKKECEKFSKQAIFIEHNLQVCPLVTPITAIYNCVE